MWSKNRGDRCLRFSLLFINCAACVAVVYVYLTHAGKIQKRNEENSGENYFQSEKLTNEKCIQVCDSRDCIFHANMLLNTMNFDVEPCENPRSYICGGYEEQFSFDQGRSILYDSEILTMKRLKDIIENVQAASGSALAKMRTVYDSCMNYASSELRGIKDLKDFLNSLGLANWPNLAENFTFTGHSLPTVFANFAVYANHAYITLQHTAVKDNETLADHFKIAFYQWLFNSSTNIPPENAVKILKHFDLQYEDMNSIMKDHDLIRNSIINLYEGIENCNEDCSDVPINCSDENDWHHICEMIDEILRVMNYKHRIDKYPLTAGKHDNIFLKNLFPLLHSFPARSLVNFLALDFIQRYRQNLGFYFRLSTVKNHRLKAFGNEYLENDKWWYCVMWIATNMRYPLTNEVFHVHLTKTAIREVLDLFAEYASTLVEVVDLQKWLPPDVKLQLEERIQHTEFHMQSLNEYLPNEAHADRIFRKFHPTTESFFNNVLQLKTSVFTMDSVVEAFHVEEIDVSLPTFAWNAIGSSDIGIEFGVLFPPFFIPNHMRLINRVLLAPTLGHEFGHAIELFLNENIDQNHRNFSERKQCFTDQFSKYRFEYLNENLNGSRYLFENLADSVGTILTDKIIKKYSEGVILPGLALSTTEVLYVLANQMWCIKTNLEQDLHFKLVDLHAPNQYRLLGKIQNSVAISEAFHCPEGSLMNPVSKCILFEENKQ